MNCFNNQIISINPGKLLNLLTAALCSKRKGKNHTNTKTNFQHKEKLCAEVICSTVNSNVGKGNGYDDGQMFIFCNVKKKENYSYHIVVVCLW